MVLVDNLQGLAGYNDCGYMHLSVGREASGDNKLVHLIEDNPCTVAGIG